MYELSGPSTGSFLAPDASHTTSGGSVQVLGSSQNTVAGPSSPTDSIPGSKITGGKPKMAWQVPYKRMALHPIPRVVDNTDQMAIEQRAINYSHHPIRYADMPGGPGTFAPYGNTNFK